MNTSIGAKLAQKVQSRQQCHFLGFIPTMILKEVIKGKDKERMDPASIMSKMPQSH